MARLAELLGMELSHISGARIVYESSLPDTVDIVEILATLMRGPMAVAAPRAGELAKQPLPHTFGTLVNTHL